jgi:hypothetical protein
MPAPRKYDSPADRQSAYRARRKAEHNELLSSKGLPAMPPIPTMPGDRRWDAMLQMAYTLLQSTHTEMQEYFDLRSESWQESERAEAFTDRMDELADLIDSFEALGISTSNPKEKINAS